MYTQPAAANYYTPPAHHQKQRGYRACDRCGAAETPATRFRLCGGCMITQYCECQKIHWPGHKSICQHTQSQKEKASVTYATSPDENIVKNLRRFTSAHTALLGWVGFQALQLKRVPSNIRQSALLIELTPQNHPQSHRRFSIAGTHTVNPRKFIRDPLVLNDIREREERCRRSGGIGTLIIILQCNDISQVMPVEVDPPAKITWDTRDDWLQVLHHFVDEGRTDFQPISTTPRGVYYG
ncbi:hypothetical protein V5O48_019187 [Marasmius crinis-equi]|uniref:MYND-type domain-containing protein n=1 Tax=Marasmius crinis-equi TaxID=585013 RepID=A0ABR3EJ84_9AGAR